MLPRTALLLLLFLSRVPSGAQDSLDNARRAQALLGPGVWSRVIEVGNESRGGVYPETVHALIFELAGILWFYADPNGTQSFSLYRGRLAEEKADFGPLLRDIEAGFARWRVLADAPPAAEKGSGPLQNGCFIESVAALRQRQVRQARIREPRLLSYYSNSHPGEAGHTVLAYDLDGYVEVFDPARPEARLQYPQRVGREAMDLAKALVRGRIAQARYLPMTDGLAAAAVAAAGGAARSGTTVPDAG